MANILQSWVSRYTRCFLLIIDTIPQDYFLPMIKFTLSWFRSYYYFYCSMFSQARKEQCSQYGCIVFDDNTFAVNHYAEKVFLILYISAPIESCIQRMLYRLTVCIEFGIYWMSIKCCAHWFLCQLNVVHWTLASSRGIQTSLRYSCSPRPSSAATSTAAFTSSPRMCSRSSRMFVVLQYLCHCSSLVLAVVSLHAWRWVGASWTTFPWAWHHSQDGS